MTDDASRNPVEVLADDYLSQFRAGDAVSVEEFAAAHLEHSEALLSLLPTMLAMEGLKREKAQHTPAPYLLGKPNVDRLGDFRLVREVGRGGMGIVYEAEQESLGRRVALKVLPRQMLLDGNTLKRFEREAQTAAQLHHSNIVPVFGTGEHDGYHFFAMQFIEGRGLDELIAELGGAGPGASQLLEPRVDAERRAVRPMSTAGDYWRQLARLALQVAKALHYAHGEGTLHRDIKPSNLLLDQNGVVWITDFGLARALEQDRLTHSGDVLGTLQYMAPEQFRGTYDVRSEVYALGLTLYELATFQSAFRGKTRSEVMDKIRNGTPTAPRRLRPEMPRDLETVILKAMAREPGDRYQTAGELAADVQRFLEDRPILARRASAAEQLWRWCRRNPAMAGLGAATLVALAAVAVIGWVAFGTTRAALQREEKSAAAARAATERAGANLSLALEAFEDVFDGLSGADPFHAFEENPETGEYEAVTRAAVSADDAELLQRILEFYGRFAERNAGDQNLQHDTARAHRRVGDIQRRLGNPELATAAYEQALALYEKLDDRDYTVEIASVHNEMGQTRFGQQDRVAAAEQHRSALALLDDGAHQSRRAQFELARTHNLLGMALEPRGLGGGGGRGRRGDSGRRGERREDVRRDGRDSPNGSPRRGRGPDGRRDWAEARRHNQRAKEIVDSLLVADDDNPELLLLKARCSKLLGGRAMRGSGPDEDRVAMQESVGILESLVNRFPDADHYRFELVDTCALAADRMSRFRSRSQDLGDRSPDLGQLERACDHARTLCDKNPGHRAFLAAKARVLSSYGNELSWNGHHKAAEDAITEAIKDAAKLSGPGGVPAPEAVRAQHALARSLISQGVQWQFVARVLGTVQPQWSLGSGIPELGRSKLEGARDLLEQALATLDQERPPRPEPGRPRPTGGRRNPMFFALLPLLVDTYEHLGDTERAQQLRSSREGMRRGMDRRGERGGSRRPR